MSHDSFDEGLGSGPTLLLESESVCGCESLCPSCLDPGNEVIQVETGAERSVTEWGLMERQGMVSLVKARFGSAGFGQFSKGEALLSC